jgi:hypothetical protein
MKVLACAVLLLIAANATSAQTVTRFPITGTAANCPVAGVTITMTGEEQLVSLPIADGSSFVRIMHGTATDSNGNHYVFNDNDLLMVNFRNNATFFPLVITSTEKVFLRGQGGATNVSLMRISHLTVVSPTQVTVDFEKNPQLVGSSGCLALPPE